MPPPFDFAAGNWWHKVDYTGIEPSVGLYLPGTFDGKAQGWASAGEGYWSIDYSPGQHTYRDGKPGYSNGDGTFSPIFEYFDETELRPGTATVITWRSFEVEVENPAPTWDPNRAWVDHQWVYYDDPSVTKPEDLPWVGPVREVPGQIIPIETQTTETVVQEAGYSVFEADDRYPPEPQMYNGRPVVARAVIGAPGTIPATMTNVVGAVHISGKAGARTRERKFIANLKAANLIVRAFNWATESSDAIEAVWEAIDKEHHPAYRYSKKKGEYVRIYYPPPQEMLKDIWDRAKWIDWNEALWNLLVNQLQDAAIGKLGSAQQKAAKPLLEKMGRPVGFGTGPAL